MVLSLSLFLSLSLSLYIYIFTGVIIKVLEVLSKTPLDQAVIDFIKEHTERVGKVKLVLKRNRYFAGKFNQVRASEG